MPNYVPRNHNMKDMFDLVNEWFNEIDVKKDNFVSEKEFAVFAKKKGIINREGEAIKIIRYFNQTSEYDSTCLRHS